MAIAHHEININSKCAELILQEGTRHGRMHTIERQTECFTLHKIGYDPTCGHKATMPCVEATFVLSMSNSERVKSVFDQLALLLPTLTVYILENRGYRHCQKRLAKQRSDYDMFDAVVTIFMYATELLEDNASILLFEDDFFWSERASDHMTRVSAYIQARYTEFDHYYLACIPVPFGMWPYALPYHWKLIAGGCNHAVVHTPSGMRRTIREYEDCNGDVSLSLIDLYMIRFHTCMSYYRPLAYQLFPATENQKDAWPRCSVPFLRYCTSLRKQAEPGFSTLYILNAMCTLILGVIPFALLGFILREVFL